MMLKQSFGVNSSIMTNKNHVFAAHGRCCNSGDNSAAAVDSKTKTVHCFTPRNVSGSVSLVNTSTASSKKITLDQDLTVIPANAIIDSIQFYGKSGFTTKGNFSIGLGQLNGNILTPLIENTTAVISNEKVGGCRDFINTAPDGKNAKTINLLQSNVNIILEHPITMGYLEVFINYHFKPTSV
jgi:hypothetical protein